MSSPAISVVIVDDHALFRSGLALLLQGDRRVTIVGDGSTSEDALRLAEDLRPEVMLLDVEIDRVSAEQTVKHLTREAPSVRIIILTMHRDQVLRRQLLRAGALDFVTKDVAPEELLDRIVQAREVRRSSPNALDYPESAPTLLSDRELQVLRMIAQARSNRVISQQLSIAEGTVKRHATNIYAKLGATSRIDAVRKASRLGLF